MEKKSFWISEEGREMPSESLKNTNAKANLQFLFTYTFINPRIINNIDNIYICTKMSATS